MAMDQKHLAEFLSKVEHRTIGGLTSKKYWFVLDSDSPYLYWYKNEKDVTCLGRISLSGAAFSFNPKELNQFEIYSHGDVHVLECFDSKSRSKWLQSLQSYRRKHYEKETIDKHLNAGEHSKPSHSNLMKLEELTPLKASNASASNAALSLLKSHFPRTSNSFSSETYFDANTDGKGDNPQNQEVQAPTNTNRDLIKSAEELLLKLSDENQAAQALEESGKKRRSIKLFSSSKPTQCENCKDLTKLLGELKDRCCELSDEVSANQDLVCALREGILTAHSQRDALKKLQTATEQERLYFVIERESLLTTIQLNNCELKREIQALEEKNEKLESDDQSRQLILEAFEESIKAKDEMIMTMWKEHQEILAKLSLNRPAQLCEAIDIGIPEGIPLDGGTPTEEATQVFLDEAAVEDVDQLRDFLMGYKNQNSFLNDELLQLQNIVWNLEEREKKLIRQNFEIEASFYQLKSQYMIILNHFKSGFEEAKKSYMELGPAVIEELIDDVCRPLEFEHRTDSVSPRRSSLGIIMNSIPEGAQTDALGFYLHSPRASIDNSFPADETLVFDSSTKTQDEIMDKAAQLKNLSDQIVKSIQIEQSKHYLDLLQKWDCFLVNHMSNQTLQSNAELRSLVRQGVPHTYRSRVWKSLVQSIVANAQADAGKGYYQSLLRKADKLEKPSMDSPIRQIDLDLARTLPTNIHFNTADSDKMDQLKRILYAFRFHNKSVGYCQGLNRIAAVALLYLKEEEAFWFLVAVVEFIQPHDYYSSSLKGAIIDQKILVDLVQEKVPKIWQHLKYLEVDLSIFTLSWFFTVFVDVLNHDLYLHIFDAFLLEGNKVLFRFSIALLKIIESNLLSCTSIGAVHSCLSNLMAIKLEPKDLTKVAYDLSSISQKSLDTKRRQYSNHLNVSKK